MPEICELDDQDYHLQRTDLGLGSRPVDRMHEMQAAIASGTS